MFAQEIGGLSYEFDWDLQATEWDWRGMSEMTETGLAPSEDFWKKFEELPDLGEDLESLFDLDVNKNKIDATDSFSSVLTNHDCMWAGTCLNKDHKPENKPPPPPPPVEQIEDVIMPAPTSPIKIKKRVLVKTPVHVKVEPHRPDTPTSLSESEEEEKPVVDSLPAPTPTPTTPAPIRLTISTSSFDHNYDKTMRPEDYGLQTPSDSEEEQNQSSATEGSEDEEEEIDVVSLTRDSLPTNPTREMSRQLQKKVASAITTNTLLNAKRAVSRRLKQTKKTKRKRTSSDEEDETEIKPPFYTPQPARRNWRKPSKKSRFSDSEPDSERRSIHNNMERMRRIDLRNAFDDLKGLLPTLVDAQRAPKVTILKDATSFLHELRQKERTLSQHVSKLRSHQEELRSTLSRLRKTLAAVR